MVREIEVFVKDQHGNPIKGAYVDIDYKGWFFYKEYELSPSEVVVGDYTFKGWKGDEGYNALTNEDGYCKLYLKEDRDFYVRVGKPGYRNEEGEEDWTELKWGRSLQFFLRSAFWVEIKVSDTRGEPLPEAYVDVDIHHVFCFHDEKRATDEDFDIIHGRLEVAPPPLETEDGYNVVTDENGVAIIHLPKLGRLDDAWWIRVGKPGYYNEEGKKDWTRFVDLTEEGTYTLEFKLSRYGAEEILKCLFPRLIGRMMFPRLQTGRLLPRLSCTMDIMREKMMERVWPF
ncbi:MAG: hypothetical protein ACXQTS_07755 [Candidatus Methanospirareceae archaeon]